MGVINTARKMTTSAKNILPTVRKMDFDFKSANPPRYMIKNNVILSGFFYALSESFPQGEHMFIRAVRRYQDQITDPELLEQVRAFIGQEAHHSKAHDELNALIAERGFPVEACHKIHDRLISFLEKIRGDKGMLEATVGLEHLTAILGAEILKNTDLTENVDGTVISILRWHAIEEIEHKAVAFDVYKATVDDTASRKRVYIQTLINYSTFLTLATLYYTAKEGALFNFSQWREAYNTLFSKKTGVLSHIWDDIRDYMRDDFHPWDNDDRALIEQWKPLIEPFIQH